MTVDDALFSGNAPVQKIPRVELDPRLGGEDPEGSPGSGFKHLRRQEEWARPGLRPGFRPGRMLRSSPGPRPLSDVGPGGGSVQDEVVIVPSTIGDLRIVGPDPLPDLVGGPEIEGSCLHREDLSRWDERRVHRSDVIRGDHELVPEDVPAPGPRQVEVAVLREVDGGGPIGSGKIVDDQLIGVRESVGDLGLEGARIPLLTIGARVAEHHSDSPFGGEGLPGPEHLVEPLDSAVKVVVTIVGSQGEGLALDFEAGPGDSISVTADNGSKIRRGIQVPLQVIVAQYDVRQLSLPIWRFQ